MIFNMVGGGGGSGATLVVSSPANVSVTVSKDDKSYTKNSGSLGSTTFKGLATGTWTVTISGNGQTATKTIVITADYAITIAFFSASINITYPATSTCVVTNSGGQTVASDTNTGSSTKTWTATVNATGTYTVTATDGSGKSKSQSVSITFDGQVESVTLSYELVLLSGTIGRDNWNLITDGNDTISFNDYGIVSTNTGYASAGVTKSKLDVTNYNTLKVDFNLSADSNNDVLIGISESRNSFEGINASHIYREPEKYGFVATSKNSFPTAGNYSLSLNLSAVSGTFYIWVYRRYGSTYTFYNIQLLPN